MDNARRSTLDDPLPPAFFPVSLNLVGRRCLVIGDDHEADEKTEALREVGADVVVLRDASQFEDVLVDDVFFVISTPQDPRLAARLRDLADKQRFMLCTIDQPAFGFIAMQAIVKAGPARIGISTGGVAPRVGKHLRTALQRAWDGKFVRFLECLATQKLRNRYRLANDPAARRREMIKAADGFSVEVKMTYPQWFEEELERMEPTVAER